MGRAAPRALHGKQLRMITFCICPSPVLKCGAFFSRVMYILLYFVHWVVGRIAIIRFFFFPSARSKLPRAPSLSGQVIHTYFKYFEPPSEEEGFTAVERVAFAAGPFESPAEELLLRMFVVP
mmetsp:Transcript_102289/g.234544  ORF Transcript_102289/g.234544 Transcript_102289/m.234544 type:complete len:122 (+) Transcript_102289:1806-2171(+)